MKNIFKSLMIMAGAFLFASCAEEAAPLAKTITTDRQEVVLGATDSKATYIEVYADGDWVATAATDDTWYTFSPASGSGNGTITIIADSNLDEYNELAAPRSGLLTIIGKESLYPVSIRQKGEDGLAGTTTRVYNKIESAEDIETGKTYLIVVETKDGELIAASPFDEPEDRYSYIYPETVEADEEGVITLYSGTLGITFVEKGEGWALQMSNGNYLFQNADGHTSFYSTPDFEKADAWDIAVQEDGTFVIKNTAKNNKVVQYSPKYGSFGSYPNPSADNLYPIIYKDSSVPNDEVLNVQKEIKIPAFQTSVSIPVEADVAWKVRNHDSWVKSFTKSGNGNGTIEVVLEGANVDEDRTATFTVIGKTTSTVISLVQMAPLTTIAEVNEWIATNESKINAKETVLYEVTLTDAVVTYVNGSNAYIEDETGGILVYVSGHGLTEGGLINGKISGKTGIYSNLYQLQSISLENAEVTTATEIPCTELTLEGLLADFDRYVSCRVKLTDIEISDAINKSDRNGKLTAGGKILDMYAKVNNAIVMTAGTKGDLICYPGYNYETKQASVWASEHLEATFVGTLLTAKKTASLEIGETVELNAETNVEATIVYTSDNETVATVDADGVVTAVAAGTANIKATIAGTASYSAAEAVCAVTVTAPDAGGEEGAAWTLVTDASTLAVDDQIVIVASEFDFALGTKQNNNNRAQTAIEKKGNTVVIGEDVQVLTLKAGNKANTFAFYTGAGYLYAASSSSNHLKTQTTLSDNSSWTIEIADGIATVKAQGTNTRNWMRYNSQSGLFACYSANQTDISIYKLVE